MSTLFMINVTLLLQILDEYSHLRIRYDILRDRIKIFELHCVHSIPIHMFDQSVRTYNIADETEVNQ